MWIFLNNVHSLSPTNLEGSLWLRIFLSSRNQGTITLWFLWTINLTAYKFRLYANIFRLQCALVELELIYLTELQATISWRQPPLDISLGNGLWRHIWVFTECFRRVYNIYVGLSPSGPNLPIIIPIEVYLGTRLVKSIVSEGTYFETSYFSRSPLWKWLFFLGEKIEYKEKKFRTVNFARRVGFLLSICLICIIITVNVCEKNLFLVKIH